MRTLLMASLVFVASGCVSTAKSQLPDGLVMELQATGVETTVESKCLDLQAIESLTGSKRPAGVPDAPCYWVMIASAKSSSVSQAITSFTTAEAQINEQISAAVGAKPTVRGVAPPTGKTPAPIDPDALAARILSSAASSDAGTFNSQMSTISTNWSADTKAKVRASLQSQASSVVVPQVRSRVDAVLTQLQ